MNSTNIKKDKFPPFYWFIWSLIRLIGFIYFRWSVIGEENIPKTGGVILASNHQSFLDPPLVGGACKRPCNYMAKDELLAYPFWGKLVAHLNTYPIRREGLDRQALKITLERLANGKAVLIFPEGTRSKDGKLQPALSGIGFIVHKAKVPVVPCYVKGSFDAFSRHTKFPKPKKISIIYGKPIDFSEYFSKEPTREIYEEITARIMKEIVDLIPK